MVDLSGGKRERKKYLQSVTNQRLSLTGQPDTRLGPPRPNKGRGVRGPAADCEYWAP